MIAGLMYFTGVIVWILLGSFFLMFIIALIGLTVAEFITTRNSRRVHKTLDQGLGS